MNITNLSPRAQNSPVEKDEDNSPRAKSFEFSSGLKSIVKKERPKREEVTGSVSTK